MSDSINEQAVEWWAARYFGPDKEAFKLALLEALPEGDWQTYNDYDPSGPLFEAVAKVTSCRGFIFSGDGFFPRKTGLNRRDGRLLAKQGYGGGWEEVHS